MAKWQISKRVFGAASDTGRDRRSRRYALQAAAVVTVEALELRMLLAATFANLPYADPFPATSQLGQASQPSSNVLYSESFTDQSGTSNGALGASDHYWAGKAAVTRTLPTAMQNGLAQMSVEFWVNVPAGSGIGAGTPISMPGFQVGSGGNWARTPNGIVSMTFSSTRSGEPLENLNTFLGVIADGQWHQYVATFDGQAASFYEDGQLVNQNWLGNSADKVGPQIFSGAAASTPSAITYTPVSTGAFDEVRVSNVALTPWQVKRNFENDHNYTSTWYVSPTGLSTNSGTRSSPLDLVTGLTHVAADNKIVLLAGTYSGAQFQVTRSGAGALHNALITGDDGSGQVIIQTAGSGTGPTVSGGAKYVTLRNLTFSSDQQAGLTVSSAGIGNVIDSCRLTSNVDALSVVNSSGLQDPMNGDSAHYIIVPGVMLENSVLAAGTASAGVRYNNSKVIIARNDTFVGGRYGAYFTSASTDVTLLNNIFTGQTGSGVYFNSDSLMDVDGSYSLVSYFGDGNVYNPASGGYLATVVDGTTNNYSTVSNYAKYWYTKQYGAAIINAGDDGAGIGYRSEQRSFLGAPTFVSSAGGDYRLAAVAPNVVDTGAAQVFGRTAIGVSPTVWDGQGGARAQGNAVDAGAYETAGAVSNTFTLSAAATTSAGVFDSSGKLIRTLWSGVKSPAGPVTAYWNGLNDNNVAMSSGTYTIKLLANNVQYVWNGGMNTSSPLDGPNVQANFYPIQSMVIVGNTAYYAPGYNEGRYQLYKFSLSNTNQVTGYGLPLGSTDDVITSIATDGTTLFTLAQTHSANTTIIKSYDLNFSATGRSVIAGTGTSGGAGVAVQPAQQNLLFVSHTTDNRIYIYNKSTLTAYTTAYLDGAALGWNTPKSIATTPDGDLWVTCKNTSTGQWQIVRYTNFAGTPTLAATVTGGLVNPLGIAVSVDGNKTLMIADGESGSSVSQQIKAYTPAGASLWTLGQAGGYATNGPAITNTKFILQGMICPQTDGSFWITDLATENRTMHFSASRSFISDIQYARSYCAAGDQNNATRVFQNFVEYQIDYSKAYTQNQGWTPVKNWSYLGTNDLTISGGYGSSDGLAEVVTMSNGRTYSMIGTNLITGSSSDVGKYSIVELTATGLRNTGYVTGQYSGYWMDKDGSLIRNVFINNSTQVQYARLALTGFDASGNPKYAASATVLATAPVSQAWDNQSPADSYGLPSFAPMFLQLDNGLLVNYSPQAHGGGMHLGAVNPATGQWQWLAMPASGPFSGNGNYDTLNWYGGNRVMASGSNIIVGYHGEGWRNAGQAGQFMQYNQDGLFIGQFGTPSINAGRTWPNPYGFAGNSFSPFLAASGNSLYVYANDESDRSLQRWQATGLDTIAETSASVTLGAVTIPTAPSGLTATTASQTQINLAWTDNSTSETGFKIERATDSGFTQNLTLVTTTAANATTYSDTGLTANTTYYYRVRATNGAGDSANSNTASAATTLGGTPTAPSGLSATAVWQPQFHPIFSARFDSQTGTAVNGVVGGTATLSSTGNGTSSVQTTSSMGDGGYYHMVQSTGDGNVKAILTPASSASSLNAWLSAGGTALNGGFDFFMRPATSMSGAGALPLFVDPPTNGMGLALGGGWNSTNYLNLLGQAAGTFTNVTNVVGSNYTNDTNLKCGNMTTQDLTGGQVYHIAAWFSTDASGLVTAKFFILPGTGAIDPSSSTGLTGEVTFNVSAPGGLTTGAFGLGNVFGSNAPMTVDYDSFRLYDAAPVSFAGVGSIPSGIALSWTDNSANETGFKVERATDSSFTQNLTLLTTTAANVTSYSDTSVAANTTYYYRVRATNAGVDSGNSNTAGPVIPLLQVSGDQSSAGQADQIRLARDSADLSLLDVFLNSVTPTYSVNFAGLSTIVISGLGGDDTLTLDLANGPVIPAGGISYDGGTQTTGDSLIIAGSSGNDAVTFSANQVAIGTGIVSLASVENRSFKGGAGNDSLALGAGTYTFATDLGQDTTHLSLSLADGAQVAFSGVQHLASLTLAGSAKVTLAEGGQSTLVVQGLTLGGTSSLDLADNAAIVDYTGSSPFAAIYSLVASSAGNHWAGNGIVSHTAAGGGSQYAIGLADNSIANLASFGGQSVDGTSVLIRFTYSGDANLDGQVDLTDLSILAGNWQMAARQWSQGDIDYSGLVDLTDLALLAGNWQKVLPAPAAAPVALNSEAMSVSPSEAPAPAATDAIAADPTPAPAASSSPALIASPTVSQASDVAVPVAASSQVAPPAAAPVAVTRTPKHPAPVAVTRQHPVTISPVTATLRLAGLFSNRPLSQTTALATTPVAASNARTLIYSEWHDVDDTPDLLTRPN